MTEKKIEQLAKELSEEDLQDLAAGKMTEKTKNILKWVGIGVGSAAALAGAGVGVAALIGWRTGKGKFGYLYEDPDDEQNDDIEISDPYNFQHDEPSLSDYIIPFKVAEKMYKKIQSTEFTPNGPKLF